jgi:hypothetical protein
MWWTSGHQPQPQQQQQQCQQGITFFADIKPSQCCHKVHNSNAQPEIAMNRMHCIGHEHPSSCLGLPVHGHHQQPRLQKLCMWSPSLSIVLLQPERLCLFAISRGSQPSVTQCCHSDRGAAYRLLTAPVSGLYSTMW